MDMGERLRAARERRGLKQGDVAARLGVSPVTVTLWENKKNPRPINIKYIRKLADILGISASELLGDVNPVEPVMTTDTVTVDLTEIQLLRLFRLMPEKLKLVQLAQFVRCIDGSDFGRSLGQERSRNDALVSNTETSDSR